MTRVKICGLTNREDAEAAMAYGADALGFIGVPGGPRYITPARYEEISTGLPLFAQRVVVVRKPDDAEEYPSEYVQYYTETTDKSRMLRGAQWRMRVFRVHDSASLQELSSFAEPVDAILLDAYHQENLGGSGVKFPWQLALEAKGLTDKPIVLAGGLTAENVQEALEVARPYAVDVSSGVESSPGVKDHDKIKAFIRAVREWDLRQG